MNNFLLTKLTLKITPMKKLTLFFVFCVITFIANASYPQTLPIDYNQFFAPSAMGPDSLVKATYASITSPILANQWNNISVSSPFGSSLVENSTLNFSTYCDNNLGKSIVFAGNRRFGNYSLTSGAEYTGKSFYLGALINFSAIRNNDAFIMFGRDYYGNYNRWKVSTFTNGTGYNLGVQQSSETAITNATPTVLKFGETHLIVLKVTPAASGNESLTLFIDPVIGTPEPTTSEATLTMAFALSKIQALTLRATPTGKIAGLRFSDNWEDVVKTYIPKLSVPAVQDATNISATGFTANWTPVANASGYDVDVYVGKNLYSTTNIVGQASSSLDITALPSGLPYNYKVVAKGDGIIYGNSNPSAGIKVQCLGAVASINTDFGDGTWGAVVKPSVYTNSSVNGFDVINGCLYPITTTGPNSEVHTNTMQLCALNNLTPDIIGKLDLPTLNSIEKIEIHAFTGSSPTRKFYLKELIGSTWTTVTTFIFNAATEPGIEEIFSFSIVRTVPTKFRIEHGGYSALSINQIITTPNLTAVNELSASSFLSVIGKTIIASEIGTMEVYSLQGAKILQAKEVSMLNTNLPNGLYIVRFTNQNGQKTTLKFIFSGK